MNLPLMLQCPRCGCDDTVRMWSKDPLDGDFSLCGCEGNKPFSDDDTEALIEQAQEKIANEDGPMTDAELPTYDEALAASLPSASYHATLRDAGRMR